MATKKGKSSNRPEMTKSAYIRKYPHLTPKELSAQASRDGLDIPPKIVSITRSQDKRKARAGKGAPGEANQASQAVKPRPSVAAVGGRSLAELLSDPDEVQRARVAIEAEIEELERTLASRRQILKILSAAQEG